MLSVFFIELKIFIVNYMPEIISIYKIPQLI